VTRQGLLMLWPSRKMNKEPGSVKHCMMFSVYSYLLHSKCRGVSPSLLRIEGVAPLARRDWITAHTLLQLSNRMKWCEVMNRFAGE
jgi:hypothetical protein